MLLNYNSSLVPLRSWVWIVLYSKHHSKLPGGFLTGNRLIFLSILLLLLQIVQEVIELLLRGDSVIHLFFLFLLLGAIA